MPHRPWRPLARDVAKYLKVGNSPPTPFDWSPEVVVLAGVTTKVKVAHTVMVLLP